MEEINISKNIREEISKTSRVAINTLCIMFIIVLTITVFTFKKILIPLLYNANSFITNAIITFLIVLISLFLIKIVMYDVLLKSILEQLKVNKAVLSDESKFYKLSIKNYNLLDDIGKNLYINIYVNNEPIKIPIYGDESEINVGENVYIISYKNTMVSYTEKFLKKEEKNTYE